MTSPRSDDVRCSAASLASRPWVGSDGALAFRVGSLELAAGLTIGLWSPARTR